MTTSIKKFIPLLVFAAVIIAIQQAWRLQLWLDPIDHTALAADDIVMYSTSWCPYCKKAREFFQRANIPFTEYDVEASATAMQEYHQLSGRGVPVIRIGDRVIQGYDPAAIRAAVEKLNSLRQE